MGIEFNSGSALDIIFDALFRPYEERVPNVKRITKAMVEHGIIRSQADILNDHVAFRTLGVPHLGIASFEKIFLHYGFEKRDAYYFAGKKLDAYWYAPPAEKYPRIFVSELRVKDLSIEAQQVIHKYTGSILQDPVEDLDVDNPEEVGAFFQKPLWPLPTIEDYEILAAESEYAAWVIYNRYYLNHYTISVHALPDPYNKLEAFNAFLEEKVGVRLNNSGGLIKTSPDGLLRQSSTVAEMVEATFAGGKTTQIPGSYVEFAQRLALPRFAHIPVKELKREQMREGFEAGNADKIFESTYKSQTDR